MMNEWHDMICRCEVCLIRKGELLPHPYRTMLEKLLNSANEYVAAGSHAFVPVALINKAREMLGWEKITPKDYRLDWQEGGCEDHSCGDCWDCQAYSEDCFWKNQHICRNPRNQKV